MATLLVIEDDELLRDALAAQLTHARHEVASAAHGAEAMQLFEARSFDAVVLDLGLPGMDGLALLDWLRERSPALPVLILTARDGIDDRVIGLRRGADDYLTKPFEMSELLARISSLLRRSQLPAYAATLRAVGPAENSGATLRVDPEIPRAWIEGKVTDLTQREWELLGLLIAQAGQVVSREAVLSAWQSSGDEPLQSNALEVYVHRLRRKLVDSTWAIRNIRGLGYMLEQDAAGGQAPPGA